MAFLRRFDSAVMPRQEPTITDLNTNFLAARKVVPLALIDGRLTVGMADIADNEIIAALRFATGLEIVPQAMVAADIRAYFESAPQSGSLRRIAETPGSTQQAAPPRSLLGRLLATADTRPDAAVLTGAAQLLDAGYEPGEVGTILLRSPALGLSPPAMTIARRLEAGNSLEHSLQAGLGSASWIVEALAACPGPAEQHSAFVRLIANERSIDTLLGRERRLSLEVALFGAPLTLAWHAVAPGAGAMAAIACLLLWTHLRMQAAPSPHSDLVRSHVLAIAQTLAELGLPTASAIGVGLSRWPSKSSAAALPPDDRAGFARVLGLSAIHEAVLMRGRFAPAARCVSQSCRNAAESRLERMQWAVRAGAAAAFGLAVILILP